MLLRQFRPVTFGSLHEQWLNHHQYTGVVEYRRKFIERMAPLTGVPEEIAKGKYINGLKDEVRAEVRLLGTRSLDHAMDLSMKVEEKLQSGLTYKSEVKKTGHGNSTYSVKSNFSSFKTQYGTISPSARSSSVYSYASSTPNTSRGWGKGNSACS